MLNLVQTFAPTCLEIKRMDNSAIQSNNSVVAMFPRGWGYPEKRTIAYFHLGLIDCHFPGVAEILFFLLPVNKSVREAFFLLFIVITLDKFNLLWPRTPICAIICILTWGAAHCRVRISRPM